jgi:hypothetical protein
MMPSSQPAAKLKRPTRGDIIAIILLIVFTIGIIVPLRSRAKLQAKRECIANLKQIDGATITMFMEHHGPASRVPEIPKDEDLFGPASFIPKKLICPAGGIYTYGWVFTNHVEKPRCSVPGHTI